MNLTSEMVLPSTRIILVMPDLQGFERDLAGLTDSLAVTAGAPDNRPGRPIIYGHAGLQSKCDWRGLAVKEVFSRPLKSSINTETGPTETSILKRVAKGVVRIMPASAKSLLKRIRNKVVLRRMKRGTTDREYFGKDRNQGYGTELKSAMLADDLTSEDDVVIYAAHQKMYELFLRMVLTPYANGGYPRFHLCALRHIENSPADGGLGPGRVLSYLSKMGMINRSVFLYAESLELAESLSRDWDSDFGVLDMSSFESVRASIRTSGALAGGENPGAWQERNTTCSDTTQYGPQAAGAEQGETRYNTPLNGALLSKDGHPLFVKPIAP